MTLQLAQPIALLWLAVLPVFWWVWRARGPRRQHRPATTRRFVSLILRILTIALLVLALANPQTVASSDELQVMFVVDRSRSVPGRLQQAVETSLVKVADRMTEKDRAGLILFGSEAALESRPQQGKVFGGQVTTVLDADLTNIESGVRLAMTSFPDGVAKRIVLVSDGNENRGNLLETAALAAANDVRIDVVPIRYEYDREVLVEKLVLPSEVNYGEPFLVRVVVTSGVACKARLSIYENDRPLDLGDNVVDVPVGKSVQQVRVLFQDEEEVERMRKGFYVYEARLTPLTESGEPDPDDQASNNRAIGFTQVKGRPAVLLVDGNDFGGGILVEALQNQGILVRRIEPVDLPDNIVELQGYDCVILYNVGAENFSRGQLSMLRSNVRDVGSGLIMIGGEHSFGAGGWLGTPVEEALPVYMDIKEEKILPNGALCCIMHTCEFPNGNTWAKEITIAAMRTLSAQDYFGFVYYPMQGGPCVWGTRPAMVKAQNKPALANTIRRNLQPGDMPNYDSAFSAAERGLSQVKAALKHIIVISDGDPSPPSKAVIRRLVGQGVTISTIAIAPHMGGTQTLKDLARQSGGNFYPINDPRKLPRIFIHEAQVVKKAILVEKELQPAIAGFSEPVDSIVRGGVPKIFGYVATSPKELADIPLQVDGDMPLLAHWRYGLGRSVAFTSDAKNRWARDWTAWGSFGQFWAQLVRWCQKSVVDANYQVRASSKDGRAVISVDAVDDEGRFQNDLTVQATVIPSDGEEGTEVQLVQTAPGHYEADVDAASVGAYLVNLRYMKTPAEGGDPQIIGGQTAGFSVPYSPEFRQLATNDVLLSQVAEMTGGHVLDEIEGEFFVGGSDEPYHVFTHDQAPTEKPTDQWQLVLLAAAIVFLLDVISRRVLIDYDRLVAAMARVIPFVRGAGAKATAEARKLAEAMRTSDVDAPTASGAPAPRRDFVRDDADASAEGGAVLGGDAKKQDAGSTPPAEPQAEASYTNRLLEAKRRARKGR